MIIHDVVQGSEEWKILRSGKFTATDFATVANGRKSTIENLIYKKAAEIITGVKAESGYYSASMERGNRLEAEAREEFEFATGLHVETVGFVEMSEYIGCSPDGLIGDHAGVEIKCKDDHTHLKCLLHGDTSYKWQLYGNMFVTGRREWYFCAYNPNFPVETQLYIKKWEWNQDLITQLENGLVYVVNRVKEG